MLLSPLTRKIRYALIGISLSLWCYGWFFTKTTEFAFYSAFPALVVIFDMDELFVDTFFKGK
jgi:hypothetical protein